MADKIKKFLTDNKGCPLTPAATKQLFVKFLEFLVKEGYGEELESLKNGGLQYGKYIFLSQPADHFKFIGDTDIPENYTGIAYEFLEDGINIHTYIDGIIDNYIHIDTLGINKVSSGNESQGKVLTADGQGGSSWESPAGGSKLYLHKIPYTKYDTGETRQGYFGIISTKSEPISLETILSGKFTGTPCLVEDSYFPYLFVAIQKYDSSNVHIFYNVNQFGRQNTSAIPDFTNLNYIQLPLSTMTIVSEI